MHDTIVVEGTGPASSVDATYHGNPLDVGDVTVDDTGRLSVTFTCPAPTGADRISSSSTSRGGQGGSASVTIEVLST